MFFSVDVVSMFDEIPMEKVIKIIRTTLGMSFNFNCNDGRIICINCNDGNHFVRNNPIQDPKQARSQEVSKKPKLSRVWCIYEEAYLQESKSYTSTSHRGRQSKVRSRSSKCSPPRRAYEGAGHAQDHNDPGIDATT